MVGGPGRHQDLPMLRTESTYQLLSHPLPHFSPGVPCRAMSHRRSRLDEEWDKVSEVRLDFVWRDVLVDEVGRRQ